MLIDFAQYIENNRGTNDQYHDCFLAEILAGDYNFHRWTSKPTEIYSVNSKQTCKPPELHTIMTIQQWYWIGTKNM